MLYYFLYNKDKSICKDWGIAFEPILHKFIQVFFSNYSYGIMFKSTFFSKYSLKKKKKTWTLNYYKVTVNHKKLEIYNGYNENLLSKFNHMISKTTDIFTFLEQHKEEIDIKEISVNKNINMHCFKKMTKQYKLNSKEEFVYGLKTVFDFENELSNFLIHISQLNETLYEYCIIRDSVNFNTIDTENYKKKFIEKILELQEDTNSRFAFEIGFI